MPVELSGPSLNQHVRFGYPAKLLVNGGVACDMFPDWDLIMKGSRISIDKSEPQNKPGGISGSYIPPSRNDRNSNHDSHLVFLLVPGIVCVTLFWQPLGLPYHYHAYVMLF